MSRMVRRGVRWWYGVRRWRFDWNWYLSLVPLLTLELDTRTYRYRNVMNPCAAMGGEGEWRLAVVGVGAGEVGGRSERGDPVGDDRIVTRRWGAAERLLGEKISVRAGVLSVTGAGLVFSRSSAAPDVRGVNGCEDTIQIEPECFERAFGAAFRSGKHRCPRREALHGWNGRVMRRAGEWSQGRQS
jgi:hypothetical protein